MCNLQGGGCDGGEILLQLPPLMSFYSSLINQSVICLSSSWQHIWLLSDKQLNKPDVVWKGSATLVTGASVHNYISNRGGRGVAVLRTVLNKERRWWILWWENKHNKSRHCPASTSHYIFQLSEFQIISVKWIPGQKPPCLINWQKWIILLWSCSFFVTMATMWKGHFISSCFFFFWFLFLN